MFFQAQTISGSLWLPLFPGGDGYVEQTLDRELVQRCQQHDSLALEQLFRAYEKRVITLVCRMIGNREEAEDIAQDIFVNVYKALPRFRAEARLTTWIYRITINHCLNHRRKWFQRRTKHAFSLDEPIEHETGSIHREVADDSPDPADRVLERELQKALQDGLMTLSPRLRSIVILRDIEGLNYDEIAETLDISLGTVKSRLNRARLALRQKIEPYLKVE
ncbi:sigma-70 family RNA polymerase sigma factor [bacterium]|nr:sigma-70 family RNA polymerase sigma factor [bacterium]